MPMGRADRLFRIVQRLRRRGATTARQLAKIEGLQITSERFDQVPGHTLADFLALMAAEERAIKNVQSHATK